MSTLLVIAFRADEMAMLPLYALGVMLSFSISQAGMFRLMGRILHLKPGESLRTRVTEIHHERNASWKRGVNAIGATATFIVFLILTATKFREGAWIVALLIPLMILLFHSIHRHYERVAASLSTREMTMNDVSGVAVAD